MIYLYLSLSPLCLFSCLPFPAFFFVRIVCICSVYLKFCNIFNSLSPSVSVNIYYYVLSHIGKEYNYELFACGVSPDQATATTRAAAAALLLYPGHNRAELRIRVEIHRIRIRPARLPGLRIRVGIDRIRIRPARLPGLRIRVGIHRIRI